MPAGELFVPWAIAATLVDAGLRIDRAIAVMDCRPATLSLSSAKSKSALMRHILGHARAEFEQWLGVHVSRDVNTDADLLSHPDLMLPAGAF